MINKTKKPEEKKAEVKKETEVKSDGEKGSQKTSALSASRRIMADKQKSNPKLSKIIEQIEKLSVLELADLVKALEEKFGVVAAAPVTTVTAAGGALSGGEAAATEEKSELDVILSAIGANKIAAIKAVREIKPDLGLKDAKDLVEAAPKEVLKGADKKTAEEAKKKLEAAGCQVELK